MNKEKGKDYDVFYQKDYHVLHSEKNVVKANLLSYTIFKQDFKNSIVKKDFIGDDVEVSTVFLTVPHGLNLNEFFETMVFGGPLDDLTMRYKTYNEALEGHEKIFSEVKKILNKK